jgi:hypothetical protein
MFVDFREIASGGAFFFSQASEDFSVWPSFWMIELE